MREAGESNGEAATGGGAMLLCIAGSSHNTFAGARGGALGGRGACLHLPCAFFGAEPASLPTATTCSLMFMPDLPGPSRPPPHPTPTHSPTHRMYILSCPYICRADVLALFGQQAGWLLERLGLSARLDPVLGMHLCTTAMLAFLRCAACCLHATRRQRFPSRRPSSADPARWAHTPLCPIPPAHTHTPAPCPSQQPNLSHPPPDPGRAACTCR